MDWWVLHAWRPRSLLESYPNLERIFRGEFVKAECGRKTNHSLRNFATNLVQSPVLRWRMMGRRVDPTPDSLQLPFANETAEIIAWECQVLEIGRPYYGLLVGKSP